MTLTVDDLRGHIESSLGDTELGLLLDAAYESIDALIGPGGSEDYPASVTEILTVGPGDLFMLSRPAESITSISESRSAPTTLDPDDYELIGNQMVRRVRDGTNPRSAWHSQVTVTYEPLADTNRRDVAAIALVKLDATHNPGVMSERLGDHTLTQLPIPGSYTKERQAILDALVGGFIAK